MVAFNFAPSGWALCNGQLLSVSVNSPLFELLGYTYGGSGSTFALPNLQGRVAMNPGTSPAGTVYAWAQTGGVESVILNTSQMPAHNHNLAGSGAGGTQASPVGCYPAIESTGTSLNYNAAATNSGLMNSGVVQNTGGGLSHENRQPFLCVYFIIALSGIFPSQG
jgi:microcystin-dependent protein